MLECIHIHPRQSGLHPATREETDYDLGSDIRLVEKTDPGVDYPTLRLRDHVLETSVVLPLLETLSVRVYQRYARSSGNGLTPWIRESRGTGGLVDTVVDT